ncbi:MAG: ABC transporter substrate-binding protein [Anaerocolumna sp.]
MKKIILSIVAFVFILAGCSSSGEVETITIWNAGLNSSDPNATVADEEMPFNKVIADFEKENPQYDVVVVNQDMEAFNQAFAAANQAGEGPDIVAMWAGSTTLGYSEYLLDLNSYLSDTDLKTYDVSSMSHINFDPEEALVSLPLGFSTTGLFYNQKIMDENNIDPTSIQTMDDLLEVSNTLVDKGVTPICSGEADGVTSIFTTSELYLDQVGPEGLAELYSGSTSINNPEMVNALESWKQVYDLGYTNPDWLSSTQSDSSLDFKNGECGFLVEGTWAVSGFETEMEDEYGVVPMPAISDDAPYADYVASQPGMNVAVTNYSTNPEASVELIKSFASPEYAEAENAILLDEESSKVIDLMNSWSEKSGMMIDSAISGEASQDFYKKAGLAMKGDISMEEFTSELQTINEKSNA